MELTRDLKEFFSVLVSNDVRFLVVGGGAVNAHGFVRTTEDFDFWVGRDRQNAQRLLRALDEFGFGDVGLGVDELMEPGKVFMLGRVPNRIDLLTSISGIEFEDAWPRRVYGVMDGVKMPLIALPDLLANKRASGRPRDLDDVAEFERSEKYGKSKHAED